MNNFIDFSIPQRQSLLGILVMFVNTLQKIVRAMWPILLIWLVKIDSHNKLFIYGGIFAFVVIIAVISYLQYYFFTFHIDKENGEFVIQKGILNKTRITIQLHKIQQVNINQSLIQRFINVYKLEIDTAGSDKKEASISAISHELATILKEQLINQSNNNNYIHQVDDTTELSSTLIKISLFSLIKIGFTSNYVKSFALLLLFFSTIMENLRQVSDSAQIREDQVTNYLDKLPMLTSIAIVLGSIVGLVLVVNLVRTVIKYFDFTIQKSKQSILLSYGLLATKNTLINPDKVQKIIITQNFFQKKLDIITIKIHQASSNAEQVNDKDKIEIPGCSQIEHDKILKLILEQLPEKEVCLLPNWRKFALNFVFLSVFPVFIFFLIQYYTLFISWTIFFIYTSLIFVFSTLMIYFSFRNYKLFVSKKFIIQNEGAWDVDSSIILPSKIQAITTQQFFWQKRTNIGSVNLSTAGGNINFTTGNYSEIKELVNYWLFQVENSNKNWM
jgi:putative membrane protein